LFLVLCAILAAAGGIASLARQRNRPAARPPSAGAAPPRARQQPRPAIKSARPHVGIAWRRSVAVGEPWAGSLVRGVRLPARGRGFRTWDPVEKRSPNRSWRRWGTDRLVRLILRAIASYRRGHPEAPPVLVGDLSRPHGGDFGPHFGSIGHMTHQNGRDADVYYPRRDRRQAAARRVDQVDLRLAQALVDAFVAAGAQTVLVGPHTGLTGPPARVHPFPHHDDHLHVRIARVR
jgi:murein endopeptidase